VPSVGYIVWDRRKKLKPEYRDLTGEEIRDIRKSGKDVSEEIRFPLVCYTGDTAPAGLDNDPAVFQAKVLIMELTFFRPEHRKDKIHKFGHMHLDDFLERADLFQNERILLAHFSARYHENQIRRAIQNKLPANLKDRVVLWL
jgi:ribonuclease Z